MEYDKGKISARGREISWLNHPCYLGYKGEVGYNIDFCLHFSLGVLIITSESTEQLLRDNERIKWSVKRLFW